MSSSSDLKEGVPPGQPSGPEGPAGPGGTSESQQRPSNPNRTLTIVLAVLVGVFVIGALIVAGGDEPTESPDPVAEADDAEDAEGDEAAEEPPTADLAPYEVAYSESDSPDERDLEQLDGASLDSPANLYVDLPEDEADEIDEIELREQDELLWRQVSWPYGDKEPVRLESGEHTVHAVLTYTDGTTERTPDATFTIGEGSVPIEEEAPVDRDVPLEPLGRAVGFGQDVTGGAGGQEYWVTTTADSGPGSLREGAQREEPTWIRFAQGGTIEADGPIKVGSNITIDGRDADVTIAGRGLELDDVENVIITNLTFKNGGGDDFTDAIQIINGSRGVWIDHNTFSDYPDGLVDITRGSTDVTVSYNDFSDHVKVMLINGGMDSSDDRPPEEPVRVTVHHNVFDGTFVRNPKARWAHVHLFNNYFRDWGEDGRGSAVHAHTDAEIYSENNVFSAGENNREAITSTNDTDPRGRVSSTGDLLEGDAEIQEYRSQQVFNPYEFYDASPEQASQQLVDDILDEAGVR